MFSNWFLKSFRVLLLPFALLYGFGVWLRNFMYDQGWKKSVSFGLPIICVGNLSVGGTGKSPMVEYLVMQLHKRIKIGVLSRGYKRKTKGYVLAGNYTTALEIGDEPMQFHRKFADVPVAVGEERIEAIPQLLHDHPDLQAIILDDAFQHRKVKSGFNILLTEHDNLFTHDFFLPTGDLRDEKRSHKRADVIIVTKCNADLSQAERTEIIAEIEPLPHQHIYFSTIIYGMPYHITQQHYTQLQEETEILLVTGIANPRPLKKYIEERIETYYMMHYGDHHIFTIDDWKDIIKKFESMETQNKIILTTEKDAMRLLKFEQELKTLPVFVLPIENKFLFEEGTEFAEIVNNYIENFKKPVA